MPRREFLRRATILVGAVAAGMLIDTFAPRQVEAAAAFVQSVDTFISNGTSATSGNITSTTGNLFVIAVWTWRNSGDAGINTPTDSKSNTYTEVATNSPQTYDTNCECAMFYCANGTGGASHNFTITSTAGGSLYAKAAMLEFSGMKTSSVLRSSAGTTGNSTAPAPGATGAQGTDMTVAVCGTPGNTSPSDITSANVTVQVKQLSFGNGTVGAVGYGVGVGSPSFSLASGGADIWGSIGAAFEAAAASGAVRHRVTQS